jgi:vacuolar-type H+-ATPase subunit H
VGIKRRDVQSSLAEMDRKLRELQRELALVTRPANQAAPTQPARPGAGPDPASTPAPATAPEAPHTVADAEAQAQAIVADARAEAARIVEEAAAGVAAIAGQIEEFQRLREELQRSATALIEEYERALRRAPSPDAAPEDEATPAPPTSSLALQQQPPVPPPATPPIADGRQFEGQLVINVGPFTDMATLGTFEQALAQLPQTEDVYVRGFEGNRALVDLKLNGPVPLLDELRRVLPFALGLVEIGYGRITIDVELGPEAPR